MSTIAAGRRKRARRDGAARRPREPPRSAATRVARKAGRRLASSVIRTPTSRRRDCSGLEGPSRCWQVDAERNEELEQPLASPRPRKRPTTEASTPITTPRRSPSRDLAARGAERAQRRELARALRDRDRRACSRSRSCRRTARCRRTRAGSPGGTSGSRWCPSCPPSPARRRSRTCALGGRSGLISLDELLRRDARLGRDADRVELARLVEERCAVGEVEDRERRAAERRDAGELHEPDDAESLHRAAAPARRSCRRPRSASSSPCASIATSPGRGQLPSTS